MKRYVLIAVLAICGAQLSFAAGSKMPQVMGFFNRYNTALQRLGSVDHSDFSRAWGQNGHIGAEIAGYDATIRSAGAPVFDPSKDSPAGYVSRLTPEQVDAIGKRIQE